MKQLMVLSLMMVSGLSHAADKIVCKQDDGIFVASVNGRRSAELISYDLQGNASKISDCSYEVMNRAQTLKNEVLAETIKIFQISDAVVGSSAYATCGDEVSLFKIHDKSGKIISTFIFPSWIGPMACK